MKKVIIPCLVISALLVLFASCEKKESAASSYADAVKSYSDAAKSVSSELSDLSDIDLSDATNALADAAAALGATPKASSSSSSSSSSASSATWKKALDDYEKFVDEYVAFMKKYKANPTDLSLMTQLASMTQKAQTALNSVNKVQNDLSGSDLTEFTARYSKLAAKIATVL